MGYPRQAKQDRYTQVEVGTVDRKHLVIMLYEGAVKFVTRARQATLRDDYETKAKSIQRAQRIVWELSCSLRHDAGEEIAVALYQTYEYLRQKLVEASIGDTTKELDEVLAILQKLLAAWREAEAKCREVQIGQPSRAAA